MKKKSYTIIDYYNHYIANTDRVGVYDVSYETYREIVTDYLKYIVEEIMDKSRTVKLPFRLGTLSICKRKPANFDKRSTCIDFGETKKQGKTVYHINEHSNYYKYTFRWSKLDAYVTNLIKYEFVATRHNKRRLAQIIKNKEHDYCEI